MLVELMEQERLVLNIVQEYLNKNRYFNMNEIIPFIIARFRTSSININKIGIEEILKSLVDKNFIVEGSKLTVTDILNNPKRKRIYEFIKANPGVYFNRIITNLEISNHVVVWHLQILLKFNFIKEREFKNHNLYFDARYDIENTKLSYLMSKEKSKKIIDYLKKFDYGLTKTQLSKDLKMHINTISKYLKMFEQINVIFKKKISKRNLYFLHEDFLY